MFISILLGRWREIALILVIAIASFYKMQSLKFEEKLVFKTEQYTIVADQLAKVNSEIEIFRKAAEDSAKESREAEIKRLAIIASMSNQINNMRKQEPPKDCQKAIDWAVQNKGDMSWPVK